MSQARAVRRRRAQRAAQGLGRLRRPVALMYPDAYEVGLPNQGVQILYEILNERPDALAERCYAVWPDLEALMREHGVPAFTVDAHRPLGAFDLLGVSFATELGYTNLLTALDLAGIPLHAEDRTDEHPVVVAGGHAAFNPEPVADFVDVAVARRRRGGRRRHHRRRARRGRPRAGPAAAPSCCCGSRRSRAATCRRSTPSTTARTARSPSVRPTARASRAGCSKRTTMDLDAWPYPKTRSCRWPRPCTSAPAWRSSAAAPAAAGSARPG